MGNNSWNGHGRTNPLHGKYKHQNEEEVDIRKSYKWLEKAELKEHRGSDHGSTRTGLSTRAIEAGIYQTRQDPRCRMCKEVYMVHQKQVPGIVYRT